RVGDTHIAARSFWSKVGHYVSKKPFTSVIVVLVFLLISMTQVFTISYEYNTMKSFPDDMPSRVGYDILEEELSRGTLAPTTAILEANELVTEKKQQELADRFEQFDFIDTARVTNKTEDEKVIQYDLTFNEDPYSVQAIDALEQ